MSGNALVLRFGTDFGDAPAKLGQLAATAGTSMAAISTAAVAASGNLRAVGTAASALNTAISLFSAYKLAIFGVTAGLAAYTTIAEKAAEQVERLNDIRKASDSAGVSSDFFQHWEAAARRAGLATKEAGESLEKFKAESTGGVSDLGERVASHVERVIQNIANLTSRFGSVELIRFQDAGTVEEKLRIVLGLVDQLREEARITGDEQFARWGDKLEASLGPAAARIRREFSETGRVFDAELVERSGQLEDRLRRANDVMDTAMKPVMRDLAALGLDLKSGWVDVVEQIARAVKLAGEFYTWVKAAREYLPSPSAVAGAAANLVPGLSAVPGAVSLAMGAARGDPRAQLADLLRNGGGQALPGADTLDPRGAIPAAKPSGPNWTAMRAALASKLMVGEDDLPSAGKGRAGGSETDRVETLIASLEKANALLAAEADNVGRSNVEKQRAVDLAKAEAAARERGTDLTDAERSAVLNLADAHAALKSRIEEATKAQQAMRATQNYFANTAESAVERLVVGHEKLRDVLRDVIKELERAAIKSLLTGSGFGGSGGGGLFGGLFGLFGGNAGGAGASAGGGLFAQAGSLFGQSGVFGFSAGGVVGRDGTPMAVNPAIFAGARHYADGGPVGIIAHAGEIVLNAAQQANAARAMMGRGDIVIENHGVDIQTQRMRDGRTAIIAREVAEGAIGHYARAAAEAPRRGW